MGFFGKLFGGSRDSADAPAASAQSQPSPLSDGLIGDYERRMAAVYPDICANTNPHGLPGGIDGRSVLEPAFIASLLRKGPDDIKAYYLAMGTNIDPHKSPRDKAQAWLRLSLEAYARFGVPIPSEVVAYLESVWCFLDLSDAVEFYR